MTLGAEVLSATCAAPFQNAATGLGRHAVQKSVFAFATDVAGLERALHEIPSSYVSRTFRPNGPLGYARRQALSRPATGRVWSRNRVSFWTLSGSCLTHQDLPRKIF